MALSQEQIVQKMIDAGEDEDNIATVIKSFKTKTPEAEPIVEPDKPDFSNVKSGSSTDEKPPEESNTLEKIYRGAFEAPEFITKPAHQFADWVTEPSNEDDTYFSGVKARAKGFLGGTAEGAASLASPANIATLGRGKLGQIAARILGGGQVAHGLEDIYHGNYAQGAGDIAFGALGLATPHASEPEISAPRQSMMSETGSIGKNINEPAITAEKPRFKLDRETGAGIPIDQAGQQIGPAQFAGKELVPEIAELSKYNQVAKMANETQKKSIWAEVRDANRAILTSFDLSAPGRQGKALMGTKAYWTSFDDMFKSWGSQRAYDNVMESIHSHPNFAKPATGGESLAERAGLKIGGKEEVMNSNLAEKYIPGVKPSERAYSAFLSKLRSDHFNTLVDDYEKSGIKIKSNDVKLKALGAFINDATGRGSLGKLEKAAPILNEAFFAPKLMAARVNMYKRWLDPRTYYNADPILRKQAIKSLLSTVGFGTAIGELARLGGADVSNDANSSDFRKIKLGNTRIDPFSGFQQYAVGAHRLISGKTTSSKTGREFDLSSGKFGMPSRASVASQFFQNKLAPIPSLVWSWMEGKDWDGQPFDAKKALLDRTVPIVMQDLTDLAKEDPKLLPLGILPIMGEGLQTYGR